MSFLQGLSPRPLTLPGVSGVSPISLHIGLGQQGLEVAVVSAAGRPADGILQAAWETRRAKRATPVLLGPVNTM